MPYKKVDITGEGTEVVDGGRGTPVDVVQEPTKELEKADTRFIASDKAPKKTVVDSDLQVLGKYYDKDGNEIGGGGSIVEGNPESEATATLSKLSIKNEGQATIYSIPQGTQVEANPDIPEGTTPTALSGLKVGSSYYSAGIPNPLNQSIFFGQDTTQQTSSYAISFYDGVHNAMLRAEELENNQVAVVFNSHIKSSGDVICSSLKADEVELSEFFKVYPETDTSKTITIQEAYQYMLKYLSGKLLIYSGDGYSILRPYIWYDSGSIPVGTTVLQLVGFNYASSDLSIEAQVLINYKLNSSGTLDVQLEEF